MEPGDLDHGIGHRFSDPELLRRALTHRSFGPAHNERLEYLGDSVLNCVVALELYHKFPALPEGELSRLRANLVNQPSLAAIAQQFAFGARLRLGEGEVRSGGARRPSILADTLEAVVGAAFLDGGFAAARNVVQALLGAALEAIDPAVSGKDPKTLLQEHLQGRKLALPQYLVIATRGEAHEQQFQVECIIPELEIRSALRRQAYELATRG